MHRPGSPNRPAQIMLPAKPHSALLILGALLSIAGSAAPTSAQNNQSGNFQRIRTFDPTKGLVPGNGSRPASTIQNYDAPPRPTPRESDDQERSVSAQDVSNNVDEQSSRHKHDKHHHKFFIFGHHDNDENQTVEQPLPPTEEQPGSARTVMRRPPAAADNLHIPEATPPASESPTYNSMPVVMPRTGTSSTSPVVPPEPPQRPLAPLVDQSARLPNVPNNGSKPALAWRARAWRLATEQEDAGTLSRHPSRVLNCSIEEALAAAASCCKSKGAQIIGQSVAAGQLGARFGDSSSGRALVVFVAKSVGNNKTILKACADSDRAQKIALLNDLILQTAAIIDGKGLL